VTGGSRKAAVQTTAANSLLAALPRAEHRRLLSGLEPITLEFGAVLQEAGAPIRHVYFPIDCVVCLLSKTESQRAVETGLVGYEGIVGMSLALGVNIPSVRAVVQVAGIALRVPAERFNTECRRGLQLRRELYRYADVKMAQARQATACLALHLFEQRLACRLLMTSDRARSQEIFLTHEYLATVLNVRRESVTEAAASLRSRDLISYHRGRITILDRKGLLSASCSCYRRIEALHAA